MDNDNLKISFDVDGTLVYEGSPDYLDEEGTPLDGTPRYPVIELYKAFEMLGAEMHIWSSEGIEHAEMWKRRLGLNGKVIEKNKDQGMDIAIDNHDEGLAKVTIFV